MNHDMSRAAIELGPVCDDCAAFDDEPGDQCSACKGHGYHEHPETLREYDCWVCDGSGVAS